MNNVEYKKRIDLEKLSKEQLIELIIEMRKHKHNWQYASLSFINKTITFVCECGKIKIRKMIK